MKTSKILKWKKNHFPRYVYAGLFQNEEGTKFFLYGFAKSKQYLGADLPYPHNKIVDKSIFVKHKIIAANELDLQKKLWWRSLPKKEKQGYKYMRKYTKK